VKNVVRNWIHLKKYGFVTTVKEYMIKVIALNKKEARCLGEV
jgi:hypothetical protein